METTLGRCILLLLGVSYCRPTSAPSYCSFIETEAYFECDYSKMANPADRPIDFNSFDPVPQRLTVYVNGFLPYAGDTRVFSEGFTNISVADFDSNYPASLLLDCGWYGSINLYTGTFANMSHIQHLKIKNCYTYYIDAEVFKDLVNLDYLAFEGGAIDWLEPDAMTGLSVERLDYESHTFPQTLGHFETRNCEFNIKYVPPGFLFNWKNLTSVTFRNSDLNTVSADTFRYTTKLRYIDLSDNVFTNIPSGLFDGLVSLSEVHLHNINWFCSCEDLWWYEYLNDRNVTIFGELLCDTPSGISVGKFWVDNCIEIDVCGDQVGFVWQDKQHCVTVFALVTYGFSLIAFCVAITSLGLTIHFKRQMGTNQEDKKANAKSRWNKVLKAAAVANIMKKKRGSNDVNHINETEKDRYKGKRRREKSRSRKERERQNDAE